MLGLIAAGSLLEAASPNCDHVNSNAKVTAFQEVSEEIGSLSETIQDFIFSSSSAVPREERETVYK